VYHTGTVADLGLSPDIVVESTGLVPLVQQAADTVVQLVSRRVRPDDLDQALARRPDDIKVVRELAQP
jgi:hypothetical protein